MAKSPLSEPVRVKLSRPGDMAAAIPHLVGFQPQESLVVVSLHGKRVGLTMRFDLTPARYDSELAEQIAVRLVADRAESALLAVCTEEVPADGPHPRHDLIERLDRALRQRGIDLLDALLIRAGRWWSYRCDDPSCCPADGAEIPPGIDIAAAHALMGRSPLPSRAALQEQIKPLEFVARRSMQQALDDADEAFAAAVVELGFEPVRDALVAFFKELTDRYADPHTAALTDDEAARVIVGLHDVHTRDRVLAAALDHELDAAQALFLELCRRAIPPDDPPTCTLLAGIAYAEGNGALANVALERALASDPSYSLARLFSDALYQQVPPSLMRRAWKDAEKKRTRSPRGH
ncbi:MAG: DUF4192 domain-containing protein [Actinomycetes bacterium]